MAMFPDCCACGKNSWRSYWTGPVRDGVFGRLTKPTVIARCDVCGVLRLDEDSCKDEGFYKAADYRESLDEEATPAAFFAKHDHLQMERLRVLSPDMLRSKSIVDVGCAGGAFLDHVRGLVSFGVAVEPAEIYRKSLIKRGYYYYPDIASAVENLAEKIDYVCSFSVIEHVVNPHSFLHDMSRMLAKNGQMIISTPNRNDILMHLLSDVYPQFFYRSVHRWYFDKESLEHCAKSAGLEIEAVHCVHRFGIGNTMQWLRDRRPPGRSKLSILDDATLDAVWSNYLERSYLGDYLYAVLRKG